MYKRMSFAEVTPIPTNQSMFKPVVQPIRPSQFLNEIESVPANFLKNREIGEVVDYQYPITARRRIALGNDKVSIKKELALPNIKNLSVHSQSNQSLQYSLVNQKQCESSRTEQQLSTELESLNKKIKKIINSNKRQVTFQSSLVVVDEQNKIQLVEAPYIQKDAVPARRKTIFRHKTLEI